MKKVVRNLDVTGNSFEVVEKRRAIRKYNKYDHPQHTARLSYLEVNTNEQNEIDEAGI